MIGRLHAHLRGTLLRWKTVATYARHRVQLSGQLKITIADGARIVFGRRTSIVGHGIIYMEPNSSIKLGSDVLIVSPSEIYVDQGAHLSIGDHIYIGAGVNIRCNQEIVIGDDTRIGQFVSIVGGQYGFRRKDVKIRLQPFEKATVRIGKDAWVGANAVVLPGASIGDGAVVGASTVVSKDVPPYAIAVGNPMRIIGYRE